LSATTASAAVSRAEHAKRSVLLSAIQKADRSTRKTLWRGQTQPKQLSLFAEEFFRRLAKETGTRMLARKGELHSLVALCDPSELNGEVQEKLDALQRLLQS
jgi:hypothetical protein